MVLGIRGGQVVCLSPMSLTKQVVILHTIECKHLGYSGVIKYMHLFNSQQILSYLMKNWH